MLNFPNNPVDSETYVAPNGVTYTFDGTKWIGKSIIAQLNNGSIVVNQNGTITFDGMYTLPAHDGQSGQALITNGQGTVSWQTVSGSGADTGVIRFVNNVIHTAQGQNIIINPSDDSDNKIVIPGQGNGGLFDLLLVNTEGNVTSQAGAALWIFGPDGTFNLPQSADQGNAIVQSLYNIQFNASGNVLTLGVDGSLSLPVPGKLVLPTNYPLTITTTNDEVPPMGTHNLSLSAGSIQSDAVYLGLSTNGSHGLFIDENDGYIEVGKLGTSPARFIYDTHTPASRLGDFEIQTLRYGSGGESSVWISTQSRDYQWRFDGFGQTTLPGNIIFPQGKLGVPNINGTTDAIRLYDFGNEGTQYNYAIGYEGSHIWFNVDQANNDSLGFKFYGGGTLAAKITTAGNLYIGGIKFNDNTTQTTAWTGILPSPTYSGSSSIGNVTPAALNLNNTGPSGQVETQLALINTAGGGGTGSAIDFFTYTDEGNGVPGARLQSIDDNNYSANFSISLKGTGNNGNNGLTPSWTFGSDQSLTFPDTSKIFGTTIGLGSTTFAAAPGVPLVLQSSVYDGSPSSWTFGTDGDLTLPGNIVANRDEDIVIKTEGYVMSSPPGYQTKSFTFGANGTLTVPGAITGGEWGQYLHLIGSTTINLDAPSIYIGYGDTGGQVYIGSSNTASVSLQSPRLQILAHPPNSSKGSSGDYLGMVAFNSNYMFYCTNAYDGTTDIWKRVALTGGTW